VKLDCDIAILGAGIVGIATAYYLKKMCPNAAVVLVDSAQPMSLTSAQSGENYRNWWPHPVMTAFTDRSIDLMEELAAECGNLINMSRRGYVLATRSNDVATFLQELTSGYAELDENAIRVHSSPTNSCYQSAADPGWLDAPTGVDVIQSTQLIQKFFPSFDHSIKTLVHIRRAGAISAQQMGQYMLARYKDAGGLISHAMVTGIEVERGFRILTDQNNTTVQAERFINAAGPFINEVSRMLGTSLPVTNTLQQKIAFEDTAGVIPRQMPFSIDLDAQCIDWSDEERQLLLDDAEFNWLAYEMPGSIHCRPDGGDDGSWVKLGWAFSDKHEQAARAPELLDAFPEIVLRGATRLNPGLATYYGRLPRARHHYGGYYTLTDENWPLIGSLDVPGAYVVGAMSGFGTMAACAAGDLCARLLTDSELPSFASALSPSRYQNKRLMTELRSLSGRGIL